MKVIKYAKENSQIKASLRCGIPKSTIHYRIKNESNFLNVSSSNLQEKTLHKGGKLILPEVELKLIQFIKFNRKMFNPISTWSLLLRLFEFAPERKKCPIATNQGFLYRLLKRNFFSFREKSIKIKYFRKIVLH